MKTYSQHCPVAHALDLVGERWSLLIVRELMHGQRRYTDLAEALPGIGTNILAGRLRDLERGGIVRKMKLPPPAASTVYELTEDGRELDDILRALGRWGARTLEAPRPDDCWSIYAVQARFRPELAVDGSYEVRFDDGSSVALTVADRQLTAVRGAASDPTLVVEVEPEVLHSLVEGTLGVEQALREKRAVLLAGTADGLSGLVGMFAPAVPAAASSAAAVAAA